MHPFQAVPAIALLETLMAKSKKKVETVFLVCEETGVANGTFVNGKRIESARLASGDRMQIGRVELVALHESD